MGMPRYLTLVIATVAIIIIAVAVWLHVRQGTTGSLPAAATSTPPVPSVEEARASSSAFLSFTSPIDGAVFAANQPVSITWQFSDPNLPQEFPDFAIALSLVEPGGGEGSLVGTQPSSPYEDSFRALTERSLNWFPGKQIQFWSGPNTIFPYGGGFKIRARLQYVGKAAFTCDPQVKGECAPVYPEPIQSRIHAAQAFSAESGTFSIVKQ